MIDRKEIIRYANLISDLIEVNADLRPELTVSKSGVRLWLWGPSEGIPDKDRQKAIALLTPFVGKMEAHERDWEGHQGGVDIFFPHANLCRVVGYKTVKKIVRREKEREPEYEEVEETQQIPITDCDLRANRFSGSDIEVSA
jgi:hypothetical protein